jgi:hypothetical protein
MAQSSVSSLCAAHTARRSSQRPTTASSLAGGARGSNGSHPMRSATDSVRLRMRLRSPIASGTSAASAPGVSGRGATRGCALHSGRCAQEQTRRRVLFETERARHEARPLNAVSRGATATRRVRVAHPNVPAPVPADLTHRRDTRAWPERSSPSSPRRSAEREPYRWQRRFRSRGATSLDGPSHLAGRRSRPCLQLVLLDCWVLRSKGRTRHMVGRMRKDVLGLCAVAVLHCGATCHRGLVALPAYASPLACHRGGCHRGRGRAHVDRLWRPRWELRGPANRSTATSFASRFARPS